MTGSVSDKLFTWSLAARSDFQAVVEDGTCSARFKLALAGTIANGWDSNRDKPGWALAGLLRVLGQTDLALATVLDLMWLAPEDILAALRRYDGPDLGQNADGSLFLRIGARKGQGTVKLGAFRLRLLQKLLEFLLTCDDFSQSAPVLEILEPVLAQDVPQDSGAGDTVDAAAKGLAKLLYRYRSRHFDDGHASTVFAVLRGFTQAAGDVIEDDSPFLFWTAPDNSSFRTYSACFFAFRDYAAALSDAVQRAALARGMDIDDPGLQGELAVPFHDPFTDDPDPLEISEAGEVMGEAMAAAAQSQTSQAPESQVPETPEIFDSPEAALRAVAEGDLKILKKRQAQLLAPILQAGVFGVNLPRATVRLLAFHPIQSALSNSLRTGKALLPIAERVTCSEAQPYAALARDLTELEQAMTDWLKIALALRAGDGAGEADGGADDRAAELRAAGVALLKQKRAKSFDRPPAELAASFARIETALITVTAGLRGYGRALETALGRGQGADAAFAADRARFAAAFADLYLSEGATP